MLMVFLLASSFIGLVTSDRIWDGECGITRLTRTRAWMSTPKFWEGVTEDGNKQKEIGDIMRHRAHLIPPDPYDTNEVVHTNPWLVKVTDVTRLSLTGFASLIRVKPGINVTDTAITSASVCKRIRRNIRNTYCVTFGNTSVPREEIHEVLGCWSHEKYDPATGEFNIGILVLDDTVPLGGEEGSQAICLPSQEETFTETLGGKGTIVRGFEREKDLRALELHIVDTEYCGGRNEGNVFCVDCADRHNRTYSPQPGAGFIAKVDHRMTIMGVYSNSKYGILSVFRVSPFVEQNGWLENMIKNHSSLWKNATRGKKRKRKGGLRRKITKKMKERRY